MKRKNLLIPLLLLALSPAVVSAGPIQRTRFGPVTEHRVWIKDRLGGEAWGWSEARGDFCLVPDQRFDLTELEIGRVYNMWTRESEASKRLLLAADRKRSRSLGRVEGVNPCRQQAPAPATAAGTVTPEQALRVLQRHGLELGPQPRSWTGGAWAWARGRLNSALRGCVGGAAATLRRSAPGTESADSDPYPGFNYGDASRRLGLEAARDALESCPDSAKVSNALALIEAALFIDLQE